MTEKEFISKWIDKIRVELKKFPGDFLKGEECTTLNLPPKLLIFPPPLFNTYQVIDESGETVFSTDEHFKAKYVIYANRTRPKELQIPVNDLRIYEIVRDYEKHLDTFLKEMELEFKKLFANPKGFKRISLQIFNSLDLIRH
ncbi:MAG: hypothetical protein A2499_06715 [Stygiobacter sp. RIFOXYC12_FULL_38_8]|nr:MAG: hypothetical protein A2X62_03965 [Stygiobacter sp. GWC2_38_9]OGU84243.1 MAG: hypothetical protein A2279_07580 [Stygiobacter sp. RIFOXYA12_FULL_38_9]OGV05913.1 MAG: hypothetical protein A2299_10785 [Stygiobacter sp. RIFOXYB2_FULL_37_11]OGV10674.1 MAG: hypothetical protein A2237_10200 [Stygiobacter sp. RIFOXYA2_FULL_38_8]OGV14504.1 MAG: hypothetical protein A2440_08680 [Stygiobacter sp. RIFOXYC2_FULL_38_25]OGV28901.1 MAG: hypothetical protein A2499_06715 [Stygiobacter sp. RIFOXYC12_FULL_